LYFIFICTTTYPTFPETTLGLLQSTLKWTRKMKSEGKLEKSWSLAGSNSSAGILVVKSHEELDEVMISHPLASVSKITVYPLIDQLPALDKAISSIQRSMKV